MLKWGAAIPIYGAIWLGYKGMLGKVVEGEAGSFRLYA